MMLQKLHIERSVLVAFWILIVAQMVLVTCHVGAIVWDAAAPSDVTEIVRGFFELSKEGNAPTWFSSFLFTLIGLACGAIYFVEKLAAADTMGTDRMRLAWLVFAAAFLFLSFDETSQLHERLDWLMSGYSEGGQASTPAGGQESTELPFYRYLLIYVPVLGVLGLAMAWFVISRFHNTMTALLFLLGMGLLGMKLVIESFEKWSLSMTWFNHSVYLETVIVEMSCLFTGATIIFTSLLRHLGRLCESEGLPVASMTTTPSKASGRASTLDAQTTV